MKDQCTIVPCNQCGTKNRIPLARRHDRPVCGRCRAPLVAGSSPAHPVEVTDLNFKQEVDAFQGTVLVDCWAPWCGPCRMVAPIMDQLASEYAGRVKIAKLNTDENPLTASQYGIQSIPTLLFFKDGSLVNKLVGALPKREIERHLGRLI
ncbi:MAG TPA: thioredoxin [Desulfatiglandales bacterium]|nr:thioredoxin [Desulfatiglandales bacterium]